MKKQVFKYFFWLLAIGFVASSCTNEMRKQLEPTPNAYGPVNQLVVIAERDIWESAVGDTFRYYFSSAYPVLPQPEPIFDLYHFTPEQLTEQPLRKELRNYIVLADMQENSSTAKMVVDDIGAEQVRLAREDGQSFTSVGRDKWARGQTFVYLFGFGRENLSTNIVKGFPAIKKRIDQANAPKIEATVFLDGSDNSIATKIKNSLGFTLRIPKDYYVALDTNATMWLRRETNKSSTNLLLHKQKYESQSQLSRENMKALLDSLGKNYIASEIPGTYMRVNDKDLPMLVETTTLNGNYALEARGIWELVNDYMGGPYVSYLTVNSNTNELIILMGFIYAPGEDKRELMQNLEHVMHTFQS